MEGKSIPPFEQLDSVKDGYFGRAYYGPEWHTLVGSFTGYNGKQYVYIEETTGRGKRTLLYRTFAREFYVVTDEMIATYDKYIDDKNAYIKEYGRMGPDLPKLDNYFKSI